MPIAARLLAVLFAAALLAGPAATAQLSASASVNQTTVGAGEMVTLTLEIEGDLSGLVLPEPPQSQNLALVQAAPQRRVEMSAVGGRVTRRTTLEWTYQPLGVGSARLGPMRVEADAGTIRTDPIRLRVVPQAQRPPTAANRPVRPRSAAPRLAPLDAPAGLLSIRAEPSATTPYVGQQVVIDYVIVYDPARFQPRDSQMIGAWETGGLWREDLDVPRSLTVPRPEPGGLYAATIKRIAVFPARTGELRVEPVAIQVGGLRTLGSLGGGGGGGLFDWLRGRTAGTRFAKERVETPAVELSARPLPGGAPASFSGAVGTFTMDVEMVPQQVAADEPVEMEIDLRGTGNVALLESPDVPMPDGVTRFDVEESRRSFRGGAPLHGQKVFTHQLVAEHGGRFDFPVRWSYFDPETERYRTLAANPSLQAVGAAAPRAEADAAPLLEALPDVEWGPAEVRRPLHLRSWVWASLALPLLALLGVAAARIAADRGADRSPEARARRAPAAALAGIEEARTDLLDDPKAAAIRLDAVLRRFCADRFGLPPELPRPGLDRELAACGVGAESRRRLLGLLATAEHAQFAPGATIHPSVLDTALDVVRSLSQTETPTAAAP